MTSSIRLIGFDLEGTLIRDTMWFRMNTALGITKSEDRKLLLRHRKGEIGYVEAQQTLASLYRKSGKATRAYMNSILAEYAYMEGTRETIAYLRKKGYVLSIISGSTDLLVERVADELEIPHWFANNSVVFDESGRFTGFSISGDDLTWKLPVLSSFASSFGFSLADCAYVGDGENDREIFRKIPYGITFSGKPIANDAWKTIQTLRNIRNIL